jgi:hypothetical protein
MLCFLREDRLPTATWYTEDYSMMIPCFPQALTLPVVTYWDGTPCADVRLHGVVTLSATAEGLRLTASLPHQATPRVPPAPPGTRVANLWEYDVVECFIAGAAGYLEVELGAGGHFLVLAFATPRVCCQAYEALTPPLTFEPRVACGTAWRSSLLLPWAMVPVGVKGVNAYVISGPHYLCYHPLPGPTPDFHQPDRFPAASLAGRA